MTAVSLTNNTAERRGDGRARVETKNNGGMEKDLCAGATR